MKANKPSTMAMVLGKSEKGQSLIEIIVALALASLVAVGLVRVTTTSIKGSRYSSDQSKITALAQKKIAEIIDYKNANPIGFWTYIPLEEYIASDGYCLHPAITDVSDQLHPTPPDPEAKMALINVKVFWDEKGAGIQCASKNYNYSLNFDTYVTN